MKLEKVISTVLLASILGLFIYTVKSLETLNNGTIHVVVSQLVNK